MVLFTLQVLRIFLRSPRMLFVVEIIPPENQVDGESFLELREADVKEMVKPIGVVKKVMKLLRKVSFHRT